MTHKFCGRVAKTRKGGYTKGPAKPWLPYEERLIRELYPEQGPRGLARVMARSARWIKQVASKLGVKYQPQGSRERPKPGTEDPVAIARMDAFIRGAA